MHNAIRIALAATLLAATSVAHSAVNTWTLVTWSLENVTFEDGGTASGSFTINTLISLNSGSGMDDVNITTTAGSIITTPTVYNNATIVGGVFEHDGTSAVAFAYKGIGNDKRRTITLAMPDMTTLTSGTVDLIPTRSSETIGDFGLVPQDVVRPITGGSITVTSVVQIPIPEPSSLALFGLGGALLLLLVGSMNRAFAYPGLARASRGAQEFLRRLNRERFGGSENGMASH